MLQLALAAMSLDSGTATLVVAAVAVVAIVEGRAPSTWSPT